ncbi:MAG: acyl-CoA thioesterase [Elusimicrobia bacterium]|nr:acyl-CoA thioesterase [Elusimicrobiota bacterium]
MFSCPARISLHHTDATGRIFFGALFYLVHETKEKVFEKIGMPIGQILDDPDLTFPLVHAEADFKSPLHNGEKIMVEVALENIGDTSVVISYAFRKTDGTLAAMAKTVHVSVSKKTGQKTPLPDIWRKKIEKLREDQTA